MFLKSMMQNYLKRHREMFGCTKNDVMYCD